MTRPPDDRSDDGLTAELREQLEEGAEEARRLAAVLKHQRAARQLVSANQAGRAACPEGYAVVAAAVDWAHAGIGRARPHWPISQPALHTLFGRGSRGDRFAFEEPESAWLVFFDESAVSLIPPVRRTWARRGHTPLLRHRYHWKRASMAAALDSSAIGVDMPTDGAQA